MTFRSLSTTSTASTATSPGTASTNGFIIRPSGRAALIGTRDHLNPR
jgi:hypothetical protein